MSKPLFVKLDAFFLGNRKVIRAGRNGRDVFLFALCMNVQRGRSGTIPSADLEPWYLARQIGVSVDEAAEGVTAAVTAGLLAIRGDRVEIVGWSDDWGNRALTRAEIQRNYRERNKNKTATDNERYRDEVTSDESSNALPIRSDQIRSERERSNASLSLPGDFAASQKARKIAADRNLDLVFELAQFRDTAATKGWRVLDWDASFCKWLRQSRDVDRASSDRARPKASRGPYVTRQRTVDGVRHVLTEQDGNQREITEEEAKSWRSETATQNKET